MKHYIIPVWFFVGVLLSIYGVLIFGSGVASGHIRRIRCSLSSRPVWWARCSR